MKLRTTECPACGYGFVRRSGKRCIRCRVLLLYPGESYTNPDGDPVFLWAFIEWREVARPKGRDRHAH